jgi:DNA polymerase-3 subunit alpha
MGKKKKEVLDKEYVGFAGGMATNGYSAQATKAVWDVLVPFADYAFNKSHSVAYGFIAYQTAYLKAHYPAEYMAALLTSTATDKDKSAIYLAECRRMGIKVLPPDVNDSSMHFTPVGTDIRFGLGAIRNVGENVVTSIVETRKAKGRYTSFPDFLAKAELTVCNKRTIESLIKAGAFDSLGHSRRGLVEKHEMAIDSVVDVKKQEALGQDSLFGSLMDGGQEAVSGGVEMAFSDVEWDKKVRLAFEREMLGLYVSDHPLSGVEHVLAARADCSIAALNADAERQDGSIVTVAGIIAGLARKVTKQGNTWAAAQLEDLEGGIETMFFPQTYQLYATQLAEDAVVVVKGRLDRREDVAKLIAMEVAVLDIASAGSNGPVVLHVSEARVIPAMVDRLKRILVRHPGTTPVRMHLKGSDETVVRYQLGDNLRVANSPALSSELKVLLGAGCFGVEAPPQD